MNALATAGNPKGVNGVALAVLIALFLLVTVMGFMASRWRRGTSMESLDEWGLGGRSFGTWVTWFLLGGDLYTAYTSIAVPAAMFALGSVNGFFAVPYTIVLYPINWHCWDGWPSPQALSRSVWTARSTRNGSSHSCSKTCSRPGSPGLPFAAIAIGALVPAAIMAISAANLFTRNIYREWYRPSATPAHEAKVGKIVSLVVKFVALVFVLTMDKQNAINFQLLGGIWILQTFPAIVFGLYTRWFHRWALIAGWAIGMIYRSEERRVGKEG